MAGLLFNTEAIVVRTIAYGETHVIVHLLTPAGLVAAMARGAKKPTSRLAAGVQLCAEGLYSIYLGRGMGTIQQVEIVQSHRRMRESLDQAAYAAYFCELVQSAAEPYPNGSEAVFRWFLGALERLETGRDEPVVVARIWEAKILKLLGASPDWQCCIRCREPIADESAYHFQEGGILCSTCRMRNAKGPSDRELPLLPGVPKILAGFERVPWERLGQVSLGQATLHQLDRVLRHQLNDFAGVSAKSRRFLDNLSDISLFEAPPGDPPNGENEEPPS